MYVCFCDATADDILTCLFAEDVVVVVFDETSVLCSNAASACG